MITKDQILEYLISDKWFRPSGSRNKISIKTKEGETVEVPRSYYHTISKGAKIIIRVSEHGTHLGTWVERADDPTKTLQNLSIVFSNDPVSRKRETRPVLIIDKDGKMITKYIYFVVEQYIYRLDSLSMKDFIKIVNKLKLLEQQGVFNDPFRKKPAKKANRTVLSPTDKDGKEISKTINNIHPRQTVVDNNRDYEVDEKGNVIRESKLIKITENDLRKIIENTIRTMLK